MDNEKNIYEDENKSGRWSTSDTTSVGTSHNDTPVLSGANDTDKNHRDSEAAAHMEPIDKQGPADQGQGDKVHHPLWVDMLAIIGVFIVAQFLGGILKLLIQSTAGANESFAFFIAYVFAFAVTIPFAIWLMKKRGQRKPFLNFGLRKTNPSIILWGIILVFVTSMVLEPLLQIFPEQYLEWLNVSMGRGGWSMLMVVVAAPVLEEILFRGIIQQTVTRSYGAIKGVLTASAIFGIIHVIPQQAVNAFFVGIILGYIYIKTRSLLPCIIIHAVNNALAFLMMLVFNDSIVYVRDFITNDTLYWIVYCASALVFIIAAFNVWSSLKNAKTEES